LYHSPKRYSGGGERYDLCHFFSKTVVFLVLLPHPFTIKRKGKGGGKRGGGGKVPWKLVFGRRKKKRRPDTAESMAPGFNPALNRVKRRGEREREGKGKKKEDCLMFEGNLWFGGGEWIHQAPRMWSGSYPFSPPS